MKETFVQITCDECEAHQYYPPGGVEYTARGDGWIVTKDNKHLCSKQCYLKYKKAKQAKK